MTVRSYDFLHPDPFPAEAKHRLQQWLERAALAVARRWSAQVAFDLSARKEDFTTSRLEELAEQIPDDVTCVPVVLDGTTESVLVVDQQLAVAMVMGMLGEELEELPPVRALTSLESAILEAVCSEFVEAVAETWPTNEPPVLRLGTAGPLSRLRRSFAPYDNVARIRFAVTVFSQDRSLDWILPVRYLVRTMVRTGQTASSPDAPVIGALPVNLVAVLGTAELTLAELRSLRPGDVVLLDTAVESDLPIYVEEKRLLWGKPVRRGHRQAVRISGLIQD